MGRYLATGKSLLRLGWKDLFSVTGCACVTHRWYVLFVCFFFRWPDRDRLIVVRQKTISHHVIHFVFVYVVGRGLPPLIRSLCKVNYCQAPLVVGWGLPPLIRSLCKVNYCQAPLRLASS